jgi:hypothetical protein
MSRHDKAAAKRIHIAKEKGMKLIRRMEALDELSADQVAALADDFGALFAEYPDVYPKPPVSLDLLRAHAQGLRDADDAARQAQAEAEEATRRVDEARRTFDAALNEIVRPLAKPEKPS